MDDRLLEDLCRDWDELYNEYEGLDMGATIDRASVLLRILERGDLPRPWRSRIEAALESLAECAGSALALPADGGEDAKARARKHWPILGLIAAYRVADAVPRDGLAAPLARVHSRKMGDLRGRILALIAGLPRDDWPELPFGPAG